MLQNSNDPIYQNQMISNVREKTFKTPAREKTFRTPVRKKLAISPRQFRKFLSGHLWLILAGLLIEFLYLLYLLRQFPLWSYYQTLTDMGMMNNFSHSGFMAFLLIFSLLFSLLAIAQRYARFYQDRATLYLIFGFGVLFACTLLFVYPINAIDIFGYIAESRVLVLYHADPMIVAPASYTHDALIRSLGSFVRTAAPYGALGVLIESLATFIAGSNLLVNLILLKGLSALFLLGSTCLIYKIMLYYKPELALLCALLFAWNPYIQLEYVVNSHNDIIMIFFVLLAILALVNNHHAAAFALVLLSSLIKYASLPIVLLFVINALFSYKTVKERVKYGLIVCLETVILFSIFVLPFWRGAQTLTSFSNTAQGSLYSFAMFLNDVSGQKVTFGQSKTIGLVIFGLFYLYAVWITARDRRGLLMGSFLVLFAFLAFAVTYVQPWYILWACLPALLIPQKQMQVLFLILAYGATMVELVHPYVWSWGVYLNADAYAVVNSLVYLILFLPALFLLLQNFISARFVIGTQPEP